MTFKLVILRRARRDVDQMYDWIARKSRDGAERWYLAFRAGCQRIVDAPDSFSPAAEFEDIDEHTVREFLFKTRRGRTYRGLFILVGDEVRVLRVRGPGQPPLTRDEIDQ
jgi:plasmid stabilization system protein ParE